MTVKEQFTKHLLESTDKFKQNNMTSKKDLRSYAGCVRHLANLVWAWRPFAE